MKKEKVDIKSRGKVISIIEIPEYESLQESGKILTEIACLKIINRQVRQDYMNEERARLTNEISPANQLKKLAKTSPELQKEIEDLLKKHQA